MPELTDTAATRPRIQWIDALRGITMILVVFQHVFSFSFQTHNGISLFASSFRMPLFFFISGFIALNLKPNNSFSNYSSNMLKKARVQLIPMMVFGILLSLIGAPAVNGDFADFLSAQPEGCGLNPWGRIADFFLSPWKHGYWFTWSLLGMFILYFTVTFALHNCTRRLTHLALIAIAVALFIYCPVNEWRHLDRTSPIEGFLSLRHTAYYFQFFVFGNIVAYHRSRVISWLTNQYLSAAIIILFFGIFIAQQFSPNLWLPKRVHWLAIGLGLLQKYCGILTLVLLFHNSETTFSQQHAAGRLLQFIGRRTLDIYLLHFFFMPELSSIGKSLSSNVLLITLVALGLALIIVAASLAVSAILRQSPFLAHYLFGAKRPITK